MKPVLLFPLLLVFLLLYNVGHGQYFGFDTKTIVKEDRGDGEKDYLQNLSVYTVDGSDWQGAKEHEHLPVREGYYKHWGSGPILDTSMEGLHVFFVDTTLNTPFERDSVYDYDELVYRKNCRTDMAIRLLMVEKYDTVKKVYIVDTMDITDTANICYCADKYYGNVKGLVLGFRVSDITNPAHLVAWSYFMKPRHPITVVQDSVGANHILSDSLHSYGDERRRFDIGNIVFSNPDTTLDGRDTHVISIVPYGKVQKRITIRLDIYGGVFIQPLTVLKGGVFDSVTKQRHRLVLNLMWGNICVSPIVELVIKDDDVIRCSGGNISLAGQRSCMMLRDQGALEIGSEQHLEYGSSGIGILGIKPGATIRFDHGARMTIDNKLLLADYWSTRAGGEVNVTLGPGNELKFGEHASVTNGPFDHGSVVMNIHLKGGRVNLDHLDNKSRELINLVYYDEFSEGLEEAELYPNPAKTKLHLSFRSDGVSQVQATIFHNNGEAVYTETSSVYEDVNTLSFDVSDLDRGVYLLYLKSPDKVVSKTFLIQ